MASVSEIKTEFFMLKRRDPTPEIIARVEALSEVLEKMKLTTTKAMGMRLFLQVEFEHYLVKTTLPYTIIQGRFSQKTLPEGEAPINACTMIAAHFVAKVILNPAQEITPDLLDEVTRSGTEAYLGLGIGDVRMNYLDHVEDIALPLAGEDQELFVREADDEVVTKHFAEKFTPEADPKAYLLYIAGETHAVVVGQSKWLFFDSHGKSEKPGIPGITGIAKNTLVISMDSMDCFIKMMLKMAQHRTPHNPATSNRIGYTLLRPLPPTGK